jgi:hypothetical protein
MTLKFNSDEALGFFGVVLATKEDNPTLEMLERLRVSAAEIKDDLDRERLLAYVANLIEEKTA